MNDSHSSYFLTDTEVNSLLETKKDCLTKVRNLESYEFFAFIKNQMKNYEMESVNCNFSSKTSLIDIACDKKCINLLKICIFQV